MALDSICHCGSLCCCGQSPSRWHVRKSSGEEAKGKGFIGLLFHEEHRIASQTDDDKVRIHVELTLLEERRLLFRSSELTQKFNASHHCLKVKLALVSRSDIWKTGRFARSHHDPPLSPDRPSTPETDKATTVRVNFKVSRFFCSPPSPHMPLPFLVRTCSGCCAKHFFFIFSQLEKRIVCRFQHAIRDMLVTYLHGKRSLLQQLPYFSYYERIRSRQKRLLIMTRALLQLIIWAKK